MSTVCLRCCLFLFTEAVVGQIQFRLGGFDPQDTDRLNHYFQGIPGIRGEAGLKGQRGLRGDPVSRLSPGRFSLNSKSCVCLC